MLYDPQLWLKSYDPGVPAEIEVPQGTIVDRLNELLPRYGAQAAMHFMGRAITYGRFLDMADRFANCLAQSGLVKGDVVAINLPNIPQYLISQVGAVKAGCAVTGISPLLTPREMAHQLKDSGARALVLLDAVFQPKLQPIADQLPELKLVIPTGLAEFMPKIKGFLGKLLKKIPTGPVAPLSTKTVIAFREVLDRYPARPLKTSVGSDDLYILGYTGGTTGPPKGARLTHRNVMANLIQGNAALQLEVGREVCVSGFPLFHQAGQITAHIVLYLMGAQALIPDPRNVTHIAGQIKSYNPTMITNVPSLYLMLMDAPGFAEHDFSGLKVAISGAAPFPAESIRKLEAVIGRQKLVEVYGMTETAPLITVNPKQNPRPGSVGLPLPTTKVRLVDLVLGKDEVPPGEEGEIIACGPQVMSGYHNKPEETANALREHDGEVYMHTGDIGRMDENGFIYIVDRAKDMISVGGYKVFSSEVESKFYEHPAIGLCAIVGMKNPDRPETEIVRLVVQKSEAYRNTDDELVRKEILAFAKDNLAAYKLPRIIDIVQTIPLTSVGKVEKKALRAG